MQQEPYHSPVIDIQNPAQAIAGTTIKTAPWEKNEEKNDESEVCTLQV